MESRIKELSFDEKIRALALNNSLKQKKDLDDAMEKEINEI